MRRKPNSTIDLPTSMLGHLVSNTSRLSLAMTLILLLMSTTVLAGPMEPVEKVTGEAPSAISPVSTQWFLQNGAFDESWDGDVPQFWRVYAGDADGYGSLQFLNPDATGEVRDNAFVFQIINDELEPDRNAYLYQDVTLPGGDYWLTASSTIFGTGTGIQRSMDPSAPNAYSYMAYYALVPKADVSVDGSFMPDRITKDDWKELWPWSSVCSEEVKGWGVTDKLSDCDYVKRAETVSVTGGAYLFVLRAELKWPDWRAFAFYIFDDLQIIPATPSENNWNECATSYCLEGLIDR